MGGKNSQYGNFSKVVTKFQKVNAKFSKVAAIFSGGICLVLFLPVKRGKKSSRSQRNGYSMMVIYFGGF